MVVLPNMAFCFPAIPNNILICYHLGVLNVLKKCPQFLTLVIRKYRLNLSVPKESRIRTVLTFNVNTELI